MSNLNFYERQKLEYLLRCKLGVRPIARLMRRDHSVISREIRRNKGQFSSYNALIAQKAAERKAKHTNISKLDKDTALLHYVITALEQDWSPEQISGRLKEHPSLGLKGKQICAETIYQYIYAQGRASDGTWLYRHLRRSKPSRQPRYARKPRKIPIPDRVPIQARPLIVGTKSRYGDWEADLLQCGRQKAAIAVQYERKAQFAQVSKVSDKTAHTVASAIIARLEGLPASLRHTITFDNGSENAAHQTITQTIEVDAYFCDPYASWQKGGVENVNGLLRQYLPKRSCLDKLGEDQLAVIEKRLNNRPRKGLSYLTPNEIMNQQLSKVVH